MRTEIISDEDLNSMRNLCGISPLHFRVQWSTVRLFESSWDEYNSTKLSLPVKKDA